MSFFYSDTITDVLDWCMAYIRNLLQSIKQVIEKIFHSLLEYVQQIVHSIQQAIEKILHSLLEYVQQIVHSIQQAIQNIKQIVSSIFHAVDKIVTFIIEIELKIKQLYETLQKLIPKIRGELRVIFPCHLFSLGGDVRFGP